MKRDKYRAIKTTVNDIMFDSKKEALYYTKLLLLKKATNPEHRVLNIELQPRYDYEIQHHANGKVYKKKAFYKADFKVEYAFRVEVVDVKGFKTATYKRKKKIIESLYDFKIIEV